MTLDELIQLADGGLCTAACLLGGTGYGPTSCSCRCEERYHGALRHLADELAEAPLDALVGRYFHSIETFDACDCEIPGWQGRVVGRVTDGGNTACYSVQLYSWWDGQPTDQVLVWLEQMRRWRFYDDIDRWHFAYEHDLRHRTDRHVAGCGDAA